MTEQTLNLVTTSGWRLGLANLLHKENRAWWGTRRWWTQIGLWTVVLNGLLAFALFLLPVFMQQSGEPAADPLLVGGQMFFGMGMLAIGLGAVVQMQGSVIDEVETGTAAWVLSKPASRPAFIAAKLIGNTVAILLTMVLPEALIAYGLFALNGTPVPLPAFLMALGLLVLNTLFYITLTLMLSVVARSRGVVLGVALGVLLGGGTLLRGVPIVGELSPWVFLDLGGALVSGLAPTPRMLLPVVATMVWGVIFVMVALRRFRKAEL